MPERARELSPGEKLWAVKEYLSGKGSSYSIADKYGVTNTSIRRWVDRYKRGLTRLWQKVTSIIIITGRKTQSSP